MLVPSKRHSLIVLQFRGIGLSKPECLRSIRHCRSRNFLTAFAIQCFPPADLTPFMIYLIGGPPRTGKSTLARILARKKSIPYLSADDIGSVIVPYIPAQEYPGKLPLRTIRRETNFSNDLCYSRYSTQQIVRFYLRQAETLWPGLRSFADYVTGDDHDYILEGWQLLPHLIHPFISSQNSDKVRVCFLYKRDVSKILNQLRTSQVRNDWVLKNTKEESTFLAIARMISLFGEHIQGEAEKYALNAVDTDDNFEEKIGTLAESF